MSDTKILIERINEISKANRPNSYGAFGYETRMTFALILTMCLS